MRSPSSKGPPQTISEEADISSRSPREPLPGLVLVHSNATPVLRAAPLFAAGLDLGRAAFAGKPLDDERISSQHAHVTFDGSRWSVTDQKSRNGTFVDGARVEGTATFDSPGVIRVGRSLFLPMRDVRRFVGAMVDKRGDAIVGPTTRAAWAEIERAARFGDVVHLSGESGAGKELAARAFHAAGPVPEGPFIAVNCAAIPEGLAERLLFGARRGAYSGATADSDGYVQAANGGTLFLDEVADLDAQVQAKLLRALEAKEILPLGASKPRTVDVRVCSATHDLRKEVAAGRFREDLYFRIGRPDVRIPPLRERRDELPWLVAAELARLDAGLSANAAFVEACLARPWPGNVRELLSEVRRVASFVLAAGHHTVSAEDLGADAGVALRPDGDALRPATTPDADAIERALREHDGNVTAAARALGMHRNQLRRWLAKKPLP